MREGRTFWQWFATLRDTVFYIFLEDKTKQLIKITSLKHLKVEYTSYKCTIFKTESEALCSDNNNKLKVPYFRMLMPR